MTNTVAPGTDWARETSPRLADRLATIEALPAPGLTVDQQAALDGSATPNASNVFATMADVAEAEVDAAELVAVTLLVRHAAGVPSGAPTAGEAPVAFDSTASTGGLYVWTGAAWVKGSTIP